MDSKIPMICKGCGNPGPLRIKHSFLGFPSFTCTACFRKNVFALSSNRRVVYALLIAFLGFIAITDAIRGTPIWNDPTRNKTISLEASMEWVSGVALWVVLIGTPMVALWKDWKLRRTQTL